MVQMQIERSVPIKRVPKAASKLLVAELKEELAGYKQSTVGTRSQLYERVQKARREARARGSEMWVPAGYEGEEPEDKAVSEKTPRGSVSLGSNSSVLLMLIAISSSP